MIPAIVKDLFNIFVQSLKLNLLFFQEKNYENEPNNANHEESNQESQEQGRKLYRRVCIGLISFIVAAVIASLCLGFIFQSWQVTIFLVVYLIVVMPAALLLIPPKLLCRKEYKAILDRGKNGLDHNNMPDPSIAQKEYHCWRSTCKVAAYIILFISLEFLLTCLIGLKATNTASEWFGMLYITIVFVLLFVALHLRKSDSNLLATVACEMILIGLCVMAVDIIISHIAHSTDSSILTYIGEIVTWLGIFLLLTSVPIPGGWLDKNVYAPLSLQYWRHVLAENLTSAEGVDWDKPVMEWNEASKEFLKTHVESNRSRHVSLNVISAAVVGLGSVWPQCKTVITAFFPESDVTVAMLLFIIVVVIMQEFRSYYWRHLEVMYRQLKPQSSKAQQTIDG